jgi:hypothetical protein
VVYGRAFFDLQLRVADTVARVAGMPLARALLDYTNLYIRLGCGRAFDPAHPDWRTYLAGLADATDGADFTHRVHAARARVVTPPGLVATFGCFSYARLSDERIRLHFANAETDGASPLARARQARRREELAALFADVKRAAPPSLRVAGTSWLYNLDAYRRLFPASYLATAHVVRGRFRHMPLWGQFVSRSGEVRAEPAGTLLARLERLSSVDGLDACFPLPVIALEAPAHAFYAAYGV